MRLLVWPMKEWVGESGSIEWGGEGDHDVNVQIERKQSKSMTKGDPVAKARGEMSRGQIWKTRAESQQIVTTRLLYCLQYPVLYSSRLQRIYPLQYLVLMFGITTWRFRLLQIADMMLDPKVYL